jgi:hypothetical protein
MRIILLFVVPALLVVAVVVVLETPWFDLFPVVSPLELGLAAVPWGHLPSRFDPARTLGPVVPVSAGRNAHQAPRDLSPLNRHPAAPVVLRSVPHPTRAVPVPAVHEEDLLLVFRDNLYAGADFDQSGCGFEPNCRDADLDLQVHLRGAGLGIGD